MRNGRVHLLLALFCFALGQYRVAIGGVDTAPPPAAPHPVSFTHPQETKLDNGLRLIVAERPSLPWLAIELIIRSGSEADANDLAVTATVTGSLLTKGTEKMSAPEIANSIESLGGTICSSAASDNSSAGVLVMLNKPEPALTIR